MNKKMLSVIIAGIWITISEFLRNEFIFKGYWVDHFSSMGLVFQTLPVNGILWMVWSFLLSYLVFRMMEKFPFKEAMLLSWIPAFVLMWITVYNLQVLPMAILIFAVPLSLIEVFVAGFIIKRIGMDRQRSN